MLSIGLMLLVFVVKRRFKAPRVFFALAKKKSQGFDLTFGSEQLRFQLIHLPTIGASPSPPGAPPQRKQEHSGI
jgi:hypothetical protein